MGGLSNIKIYRARGGAKMSKKDQRQKEAHDVVRAGGRGGSLTPFMFNLYFFERGVGVTFQIVPHITWNIASRYSERR